MAADLNQLFARAKGFFVDATDNVMVIYAEKGIEPFKKPLLICVPVLLVLYAAVYSPLSGKISMASMKVASADVVSQGAGDYEDAKQRLMAFQAKLPLLRDKDDWLNYLLMRTATAHGISFEQVSAQTEEDAGGVIVASRKVDLVTTYDTLGKWLADIENSPIFLRIVSLTVQRDADNPSRVKVSMKLSTLFAKPDIASGLSGAAAAAPAGGMAP